MKKFLIIALTVNLISQVEKAFSCAGGDDDFEYKYFFSPDLLSDTSLVRYFPEYTSCDVCGETLKRAIIEEWQRKFPQCSDKDIRIGLFEKLSITNTTSLKNGVNPLSGNAFYNYIISNNLTEFSDYLDFVAKDNKLMMGDDNSWDTPYWEEEKKNIEEAKSLLALTREKYNTVSDLFLKERYAFQIVKLLHYTENYAEALKFFEEVYPNPGSSLTYFRTLGYYAGAKRKTGKAEEAKYIFATIFDKCAPIRYQAYKDFKFIDLETDQWNKSLSLAKTNSEKSAMWVAQNIYDYTINIPALKELYETDSSSARLELALIKQLNNFHYQLYIPKLKDQIKLDSSLLIKEFKLGGQVAKTVDKKSAGFFARIWEAILNFFRNLFGKSNNEGKIWQDDTPDIKYIPVIYKEEWAGELLDLLNKIITEKKVKNPNLFILAKGYLQIAGGEFKEGQTSLLQIKKGDITIDKQVEYLLLWADLLSKPSLDQDLENKLLVYLKKNGNEFELEEELARRYYVERQYEKAFQAIKRENLLGYFNEGTIEKIINNENKNLTPAFIAYFGKTDLEKLKATYAEKLFLSGRFEEAVKIKDNTLEFYSSGHYDEDWNWVSGEKLREDMHYSDIVNLDKKATAESFLAIAEALATSSSMAYNSTPWYNYYPYSYPYPSAYPFNLPVLAETIENRLNYYGKVYYSTDLSEFYYRKAHDLLKTDEEKASALLRAQEIAMKDKYVFRDESRWSSNFSTNKHNYYKELKEKYPNTNIVNELNNSCAFFRNEKISYY